MVFIAIFPQLLCIFNFVVVFQQKAAQVPSDDDGAYYNARKPATEFNLAL